MGLFVFFIIIVLISVMLLVVGRGGLNAAIRGKPHRTALGMKLVIVLVAFFAGVPTTGASFLVMVYQIVAEAAVPVRTIAQAFGLNRVGDIDFGPARASVRSIEFYCVVASLAATGARLAASRNISISTTGAIPITHNDSTQ